MRKVIVIIVVVLFTAVMLAEETAQEKQFRLCMVVEQSGSYVPACTEPSSMNQLMTTCREAAYSYLRKEIHAPVYVVDEKGKIRWFCR